MSKTNGSHTKRETQWLHTKLIRRSRDRTESYIKLWGDWTTQDSLLTVIRHAAKIRHDDTDGQTQDICQVIMLCLMMLDKKGLTEKQINSAMTLAVDYADMKCRERQLQADGGGVQ